MEQQELTPKPHRNRRLLILSVPIVLATLATLGYAAILYAPDFIVAHIYPLIYPSPYVPPKPVYSNSSASSSVSVPFHNNDSFLRRLPFRVKVAVSSSLLLVGIVIIVVIGVLVSRGLSQGSNTLEEGSGKPVSGDSSEQTTARGQESKFGGAGRVAGVVVGVILGVVVIVVGIAICTKLGSTSNPTGSDDVVVEPPQKEPEPYHYHYYINDEKNDPDVCR
jgi:hypothetical protein